MISTEMLLEAEPKPSLGAMASVNPYKSTKNLINFKEKCCTNHQTSSNTPVTATIFSQKVNLGI